jgi:glycosyltransferase involved in cell wall biosynthesis
MNPVDAPRVELMIVTTGLQTGGAERMLVKLLARVDRTRYAPVVVSLAGPGTQGDQLQKLGIECIYPARRGITGLLGLLWSVARRLRRSDAALVQGWMYHGCFFAAVAHRLSGRRAPLLWSIRHSLHDLSKETRGVRLLLRALAWSSPGVALCVYPSRVAAAQHADLGIRCRSTLIVANGFELERFRVPDADQRAQARQRFAYQRDERVIAHVARYHPMKDHAGLLRAFASARQRTPSLRLLLAGQGVAADNPALTSVIDGLGVREQVALLGELSDVREVLAAADMFCISSQWGEAFPNALGEAMATGLPAVCTDVGDCREILGPAGIVVPPGDSAELADAFVQLAQKPDEELQRLGTQARERVAQHYDIDTCVATYQRAYAAQFAPRLLMVVNVGWFFVSHRLPIALAAKQAGYEVHIATALDPELDRRTPQLLASHGLILHELQLTRSGTHPLELIRVFWDLLRLYGRVRPTVVHLVALKPLLLGGMAARVRRLKRVVLAVPGRGSVFSSRGILAALRRWVAMRMYKLAYRRGRSRVIVQNAEDRDYFIARRVFAAGDVRLIRGSGVNTAEFRPGAEPPPPVVVVLASRMLREKGISDFVAAAGVLKSRGVAARFALVGDPDPGNPHSHTREELQQWAAEGTVEWWGFRSDMQQVFAQSHVVCLPTFYGEGVPKVLIEACACARPIVTTDMPGCRDIVRHGHNGLLVPARNVTALAGALEQLIGDAELRRVMGQRGRALAEQEFDLTAVIEQTLAIYRELRQ